MTLFGGICQSSGTLIKIAIKIHTSKNTKVKTLEIFYAISNEKYF